MTWSATLLPARGRRTIGLGGRSESVGLTAVTVARRERPWGWVTGILAGSPPEEFGLICKDGKTLPRLREKVDGSLGTVT